MNTPTLYKKKDINTVRDRETSSLTSNEKTQVSNTLSKFFELFKLKHLWPQLVMYKIKFL